MINLRVVCCIENIKINQYVNPSNSVQGQHCQLIESLSQNLKKKSTGDHSVVKHSRVQATVLGVGGYKNIQNIS